MPMLTVTVVDLGTGCEMHTGVGCGMWDNGIVGLWDWGRRVVPRYKIRVPAWRFENFTSSEARGKRERREKEVLRRGGGGEKDLLVYL